MDFETEQPENAAAYTRPQWQVWAARIGLALFFLFLILYYLVFFSGGYGCGF